MLLEALHQGGLSETREYGAGALEEYALSLMGCWVRGTPFLPISIFSNSSQMPAQLSLCHPLPLLLICDTWPHCVLLFTPHLPWPTDLSAEMNFLSLEPKYGFR